MKPIWLGEPNHGDLLRQLPSRSLHYFFPLFCEPHLLAFFLCNFAKTYRINFVIASMKISFRSTKAFHNFNNALTKSSRQVDIRAASGGGSKITILALLMTSIIFFNYETAWHARRRADCYKEKSNLTFILLIKRLFVDIARKSVCHSRQSAQQVCATNTLAASRISN